MSLGESTQYDCDIITDSRPTQYWPCALLKLKCGPFLQTSRIWTASVL